MKYSAKKSICMSKTCLQDLKTENNKTEDPSVPDAWIIYKKGHVRLLKEPSLTFLWPTLPM